MNDPFYDIKEKRKQDLHIFNNSFVQIREKCIFVLNKANEARINKDYELEVLYLIHYIDLDKRDFEAYDRIISRVLDPENGFDNRIEKLDFYVRFLHDQPISQNLLKSKIFTTERNYTESDKCLKLVKKSKSLDAKQEIATVLNYLKYDKKKALYYLKTIQNKNFFFEINYLIEILTLAINVQNFDYNSSLNNFSTLAQNCEEKYMLLIKLGALMCKMSRFLNQESRNLILLEQCFNDCEQILAEIRIKAEKNSIFKTALNIKVIILHNLYKLKSNENDRILLNKILEENDDITLENRVVLLYHYNNQSERGLIKILDLLEEEIDSFRFKIQNEKQNKNFYLNKEYENFFYYHSLFLYLHSELTRKRKNEEILTEDDVYDIQTFENCIKSVKHNELSSSNQQTDKKTLSIRNSATSFYENETLSSFEIANYLNFIGWIYYNSKNEYDKAGDYFERARILDQRFFRSKIFFYLKINDYNGLIKYIKKEIKEYADDEAYFYLAYAYFHKGVKIEAFNVLNKLNMLNGLQDKEKFCDDFFKNELEYDKLTMKFKKNIPKYEFIETYLIDLKESFIINDVFDVVLDIKIRLETNTKELKFNNEYFYLFKSKLELEKSNEYNKISDDFIKKALCINKYNICSNSVKYMINLLKYNDDDDLENNKIRNKKVENDHYLNYLFDIRKDYLDQYFQIIEYYKKKIFSMIKKHGLIETKTSDFSELNENLMNIYNGNYDKVIKYLNNLVISENSVCANQNEEHNENIISLNASIISLKKYIQSAKLEEDQKPDLISIAKIFYWLIYKLYENKNYAAIKTVKLDVFDLLKEKFKFTTNNKHDIVYYLNELNYYLGVVYFRDGNYGRSKQFFESYSLAEKNNFYHSVRFYLLVLKKIYLINQTHYSVEKKEIARLLNEFNDLAKNDDEHANEKYKSVNEIEINFHQAQCYFYLDNFNACLDLLNEHKKYLNLVKENKNLAFNQDDVYFYKIQVWYRLEKYKEIKEFLDILEQKNDFFNHQPEYVDLINYFRAVSLYKLRKEDSENRQVKYFNSSLKILDKIENIKFEFYIDSIIFRIDLTHCLINIHLNNYIKLNEDKLELEKLVERFDNYILKLDQVVTDELIEKHKLGRIWEYKLFSLFYFNNFDYDQMEGFIKKRQFKKYYENNKQRNFVEQFYLGLTYFRDKINFFDIFFQKNSNLDSDHKENLSKCEDLLKKYQYENETYKNLTTINKINLYFCRAIIGILNSNKDLSKDVIYLDKVYELYEKDFKSAYYSDLYFVFDIRIEFYYYKSIALLKQKDYDGAQNFIRKAIKNEKSKKQKTQDYEKLLESIQFIKSYIGYKRNKENSMNTFDCDLEQNAKYLRNEVNFYKAKCNLKNNNLEESIKYLNSIDEKKHFSRTRVLIKYKIDCNFKLGILFQQTEKKHGDKNEYLENTITLIDNNQDKLTQLNDFYTRMNKDKRVNFDLYKAKCLYYLDNKDEILYEFLCNNQTKNEPSADLEYLKGVAIMRFLIKTSDIFHFKMINLKGSYINETGSSKIKEYVQNLEKAQAHLTNFLCNQSYLNKNEGQLELYDISVMEKLYTTKFYLAIIYQHKYFNKTINSLFHFAEIYRSIVNEIEIKKYTRESENTILKDVDDIRKILDEIFKNLSENKTKLSNLKLREFNKNDFCFYFAIALFKSKLYEDNRYSEQLIEILENEADLEFYKKTYVSFFKGLIYYKNSRFQEAIVYFHEAKYALNIANFYYQCCLYQTKSKTNKIKDSENIYNTMRNILVELTEINGLENFSLQNLEDLFEIMISTFYEVFKSSNEKKNLAVNFKKSIESCKVKEELKSQATNKYNERIKMLDYFSCVNKDDFEEFLNNISNKEKKTHYEKYFMGIVNFKLYEMSKNEIHLNRSHDELDVFFHNNSLDSSKINLLLNTKFYLIKYAFEKEDVNDLEKIEHDINFIRVNKPELNNIQNYLIDFDDNILNYYLIKTYFYRKNYLESIKLLDVYIKSNKSLTDEIKYIFNVCLINLLIKNNRSSKRKLDDTYILNKTSPFYDNNQIHVAHYYFKLNKYQKCNDQLVDIFNRVFHENAGVKINNKFQYEKYEYYLLINCLINSSFKLAIQNKDLNTFTAISEYCEKGIKFYSGGIFYKDADSNTDTKLNLYKKLYFAKYYSKNYEYIINENDAYFSQLAEYNYLKGACYYKESTLRTNKFDYRVKAKENLKKFIDNYKYNKNMRINVLNANFFLILINFDESANEDNVNDIEPLIYLINETKRYMENRKDFKIENENLEESRLEFDLDEIYYCYGIFCFQSENFQDSLSQFDLIGDRFLTENNERKNLVYLYRSVCVYNLVDKKENVDLREKKLNEAIDLLNKIEKTCEFHDNSILYLGMIYYDLGEYEKSYETLSKLNAPNEIKNLFINRKNAKSIPFRLYEEFIIKSARRNAFKIKENNYYNNEKFKELKRISFELINNNKSNEDLNSYTYINFAWALNFLEQYSESYEFFNEMRKKDLRKFETIMKSEVKDDFYYNFGVALFKKSGLKSIYNNLLNNRNCINLEELNESKTFLELANKNLNYDRSHKLRKIGKDDELIILKEKKFFINFYLSTIYSSEGDFENAFSCFKVAYDFYFNDFLKSKSERVADLKIEIKLDDIEFYSTENLLKIFNMDSITTEFENYEREIYYDLLFSLFNIVFKNYEKYLSVEENLKKMLKLANALYNNIDRFSLSKRFNLVELVYFYKLKLMTEISLLKNPDLKKTDPTPVENLTHQINEYDTIIEFLINSKILDKGFDASCCFFVEAYYLIALYYFKDENGKDYYFIKKLINSIQNSSQMITKEGLVEKIYILYIKILHEFTNHMKLSDAEINDCLVKLKNFKETYSFVFKYEQTEWEKYKIETLKNKTKYLIKNCKFESEIMNDFENSIRNAFYKNLEIKRAFEEAELKINNKLELNDGIKILTKLNADEFQTKNYKKENDDFRAMKFKIVHYLLKSNFENKTFDECKRLFNENKLFLFDCIEKASLVPLIYYFCVSFVNTEKDWTKIEELVDCLNENDIIEKNKDFYLTLNIIKASILYKRLDYIAIDKLPAVVSSKSASLNEEFKLYKFGAGYWLEYEKLYVNADEFFRSLNKNTSQSSFFKFFQIFAEHEIGKSNQNLETQLKDVFKSIEESKKNDTKDDLYLTYYRNNVDYDLIKGLFLFIEKNYTESLKYLNFYTEYLETHKKENLSIFPSLMVNCYKVYSLNKISEEKKKLAQMNSSKLFDIENTIQKNFNEIEIFFNERILEYVENIRNSEIKTKIFKELADFYFNIENYSKCIEISKRLELTNDELKSKIAISNYKIIELSADSNKKSKLDSERKKLIELMAKNPSPELCFHLFSINLLLENYKEAFDYLNKIKPTPFDYEFNLGMILYRQKKFDEAQVFIKHQMKASNENHLESYFYFLLCKKARNEGKSLYEIYKNKKSSAKFKCLKICDKALFCSRRDKSWLVEERKEIFQALIQIKKKIFYKQEKELKTKIYISEFWRGNLMVDSIQKTLERLGFEFSFSALQNSVMNSERIDDELNNSYFVLLFLSNDYLNNVNSSRNLRLEFEKMQTKCMQNKNFCTILFDDLKWSDDIKNFRQAVNSNPSFYFDSKIFKYDLFRKNNFFKLIDALTRDFEKILI